MMKHRIGLAVCLMCFVSLAGCDLLGPIFDPAYFLRGTWVLDHNATTPDESAYYEFIVNDNNTYEIIDFSSVTIEKGVIASITEDSFENTISVQTLYPTVVGSTGYAKWSVANEVLTVAFYSDATMGTLYITFVCTKP